MARSLITFPIRLGLRGANMAVDGAMAVAGHALGMAGRVAEVLTKDGGPDLDIDGREHEPQKSRERRRPGADKPHRERSSSPAAVRPAEAASPTQPEREPEAAAPEADTETGTTAAAAQAPETEPAAAQAPETEPAAAQAPETEPAAAQAPETEPAAAQAPETEPAAAQAPETERAPTQAPETEPAPVVQETPAHVSEEPTLVEEVAEAGAEDGAGAEVRVEEPWENYGELSAGDVIDRITGASTAELAAVELYEQSHRRRRTVLEAVERQLRRAGTQ